MLWREVFGDIRRESERDRINNLLHYINTDGLPEEFRRLTKEYLSGIIQLINDRLMATPFSRQLNDCTDRIPEKFYRINLYAFDALQSCPHCISEIGVKYVNSVHQLVLELFRCLDTHILPVDGLHKSAQTNK